MRKIKLKTSGSHSLNRIKKLFPKVETVSDETKQRITVTVKETDTQTGKAGLETSCALAKACCRQLRLDGAIIGLCYSYLIRGTHAKRYMTPITVAREMVSFDRNRDFDEGTYHLAPVSKSNRLGTTKYRKTSSGPRKKKLEPSRHIVHKTARVRLK